MTYLRRVLAWWAPAGVFAVVAALSVRDGGWPRSTWDWLMWAAILLIGLAESAARSERKLSLWGMRLHHVALWAVFGLVFVAVILAERTTPGVMLVTGVLAFVVAMEMAESIPERHRVALDRLVSRGVLTMTREAQGACLRQLEVRARKATSAGGPAMAAVMLVGWIVVTIHRAPLANPLLVVMKNPQAVFDWFGAWFAGERTGQMIAYGTSWRLFKRGGIQWRLIPGHRDRAGGFKPAGDFFLYESGIGAIPAIYLTAWSLIFLSGSRHSDWLRLYIFLLITAIVVEVAAFFWPMRSIHALMQEQKILFQAHADRLSLEIDQLQQLLCERPSASERQQIKDSIADLADTCMRIDKVPTWPIDPSIRRRFGLSHIALLLPLITFVLSLFK